MPSQMAGLLTLPVQLQSKLKLPRVESGGRPTVETAVACALPEGIHIVDEWRRGPLVEPIEQVESFGDDVEPHAFAETNRAHQPRIEGHKSMSDAHVTREEIGRASCRERV